MCQPHRRSVRSELDAPTESHTARDRGLQ
jgi:hypothetical protein